MRRPLTLLALFSFGSLLAAASGAGFDEFITRRGDRLFEGEREYRWVSVNAPDSFQLITNYRFDAEQPDGRYRLPNEYELRDCVRTVRQMGGRVLRTFVITCHRGPHPMFAFDLAADPVVPNEEALRVLDRLLQICHEEGVRLIIPLVAYNSGVRGDWHTYGEDFWKVGSPANRKFKEVVRLVLSRTNHYTGKSYLEDKAILGWQTGNELVVGDDPDRRAWLHDFAAYVKAIDPHHLLIDGRNKPNDVYDRYEEFATDPNIDAMSYHTYVNLPQADSPAGTLRLIREQLRGKIPVIVTEVAMYTKPAALRALLDEVISGGAVGANWWAIRFHNRDGGFYKHSDRNSQFEDLNWPGFADAAGYLPEIAREQELLAILVDYAARITQSPPIVPETPRAPVFLPASDPGHLAWQGATGASGYDLERAASAAGPWSVVATAVPDHLTPYTRLYNDTAVTPGQSYFYRVIASNAAGRSAPSNIVGPLRADRLWLIDDLFDGSRWAPTTDNVAIDKSYAHTSYLEDVAVARRAEPKKPATLAYRVAGSIRSLSVTVFDAAVTPQIFAVDAKGSRREITPRVTAYQGGKRARLEAELPDASAAGIEIQLSAGAAEGQAIGRVELAWVPAKQEDGR
jgi:hypothetical protein